MSEESGDCFPQDIVHIENKPLPVVSLLNDATIKQKNFDAKGKFAPGNKMGKGNPFGDTYNKFRSSFLKGIKQTDLKELSQIIMDRALGNKEKNIRVDYNYVKLACELLLPKPKQEVELTTINLTPEEAEARIQQIFGINIEINNTNE